MQPGFPTFLAPLRAVSKKVSLEHPLGRKDKNDRDPPALSPSHVKKRRPKYLADPCVVSLWVGPVGEGRPTTHLARVQQTSPFSRGGG